MLLVVLYSIINLASIEMIQAANCQPPNVTSYSIGYYLKGDSAGGCPWWYWWCNPWTYNAVSGLGGDVHTHSKYGASAGGIMYVVSVILPDTSVLQIAVYMDDLKVVAWYGLPNGTWYNKLMGYMKEWTWYTMNIYYSRSYSKWVFYYDEIDPNTRQGLGKIVMVFVDELKNSRGFSAPNPSYTILDSNQIPLVVESYSYDESLWRYRIGWLHMGINVFKKYYDGDNLWYWTSSGYLYAFCITRDIDYGTKNLIGGGGIMPSWMRYSFYKASSYYLSDYYVGPNEINDPANDAGKRLY